MRIIYFCLLLLPISLSVFSQSLELQNMGNSTKHKYLKETDYLELKLRDVGDNVLISKTYYGFLTNKTDGKLELKIDYEYIEESSLLQAPLVMTTKELYDTTFTKLFTDNEIELIVNHKRSETIFNNIAEISLLGAIISPLFCIDYKNWDFNTNNYFVITGGFLGTALFSYTISITFGKKTFHIYPNEFEKEKKIWKIL